MFSITQYRPTLAQRALTQLDPLSWANELFNDSWAEALQPGLEYDEKEGLYKTELNLAGYKKEEINIEAADNQVTVTAENKRRGKATRSFYVSDIDTERITAKLEEGCLTLILPKLAEKLPKRIEIN